MTTEAGTPEFSRQHAPDRLPPDGFIGTVEATEAERAALAKRFGLPSIESLTAEYHLKLVAGGPLVRLTASFAADVTQTCVVTLDPFAARVEDSFEMLYGPAADEYRPGQEIHLDVEASDPPEPFDAAGMVDVGEAVAEHLALALDPFPRKPGAAVTAPKGVELDGPDTLPNTPFSALAALQKKSH